MMTRQAGRFTPVLTVGVAVRTNTAPERKADSTICEDNGDVAQRMSAYTKSMPPQCNQENNCSHKVNVTLVMLPPSTVNDRDIPWPHISEVRGEVAVVESHAMGDGLPQVLRNLAWLSLQVRHRLRPTVLRRLLLNLQQIDRHTEAHPPYAEDSPLITCHKAKRSQRRSTGNKGQHT
jgi:hypothetical protein